jgi:uncharacterized protein (DUF2235 family)
MKKIVICCDGTNNQLNGDLTNVVRLFEIAVKGKEQVVFYDPGVGTATDPLARGPISKRWSLIAGLAFGTGLEENVLDAYRYLMRVYEQDDEIYLFGFSRGAFTIRVLAGILHALGLLHRDTEHLLPYLWRCYRSIRTLSNEPSEAECDAFNRHLKEIEVFRRSFSRPVRVKFLGPWDTVGSVGLYNCNQAFAYTFQNDSVDIVRHAVALDERRAAFRSNVFKADATPVPRLNGRPRVMNVWFPGVHSDIGGGYPWPQCSGLAMLAFEWMVREAVDAGLRIDQARLETLLAECPPDPLGPMHISLKGGWWAIEYLPARRYDWAKHQTTWRYQPDKPRRMIESPYLHRSVNERMEKIQSYRPASLTGSHQYPIEETRSWDLST